MSCGAVTLEASEIAVQTLYAMDVCDLKWWAPPMSRMGMRSGGAGWGASCGRRVSDADAALSEASEQGSRPRRPRWGPVPLTDATSIGAAVGPSGKDLEHREAPAHARAEELSNRTEELKPQAHGPGNRGTTDALDDRAGESARRCPRDGSGSSRKGRCCGLLTSRAERHASAAAARWRRASACRPEGREPPTLVRSARIGTFRPLSTASMKPPTRRARPAC